MEILIRATMSCRLTPTRRAIIKQKQKTSTGKDVEKLEPLHTVAGIVKWYSRY